MMITTIAGFRPRRGTDEITNFLRKAFFWGKVSRPPRSRHFLKKIKKERKHTGKAIRE
jgi:hypothetical protein